MKTSRDPDGKENEPMIGRSSAAVATVLFFLFLLLPALSLTMPRFRPGPGESRPVSQSRRHHLDRAAQELPLLQHWRREDQRALTKALGLGNSKVHVAAGGWLHYLPDLEAVYGKGPFHVEPPSVAREKHARTWAPPLPVIADFARQLAERNIRLVFVPVPTKAMLCREGLGLRGVARPAAWPDLRRDLEGAGIEFVDLFAPIRDCGPDENRFLKQDTHWTPLAMEASARAVAARLADATGSGPLPYPVDPFARSSRGDLVGMLNLGPDGEADFPLEEVGLRRPRGETPVSHLPADVVLLGDSFVNVFEDPSLGFGEAGETSLGAGFASHLAHALGRSLQVVAINGGGATAVREAFAALPEDRIAPVRTVVWVLSARDVLLPEIPARRAGIEWRKVALREGDGPTAAPPALALEIVATLTEASAIEDPATTPYASAIYSTLFRTAEGEEHNVFLWAFRNRKREPSASLQPGSRYRLRLVPLEQISTASRATRLDDFFRPDLVPWFAESWEEAD